MGTRRRSRREQILTAATELFGARPYDDVSIDDIAAAAGVAHGLLFHYFGSKRGLWLDVLRSFAAELRQIDVDLPPTEPRGDQVRSFLDRHLLEMSKHPGLYRTLMRGAREIENDSAAFLEHELHPLALRRLFELLEIESPTPALTLLTRSWVALVEEATLGWLENPGLVRREVLVEVLLRHLAVTLSSVDAIDRPCGADRGGDLFASLGVGTTG